MRHWAWALLLLLLLPGIYGRQDEGKAQAASMPAGVGMIPVVTTSTAVTVPATVVTTTTTTAERVYVDRADRGTPRVHPTTTTTGTRSPAANSSAVPGLLQRIGGCECCGDPAASGGWTATNRHSTASGRWQFLDTTWAGFGGYKRARDAPPSVQTAKAIAEYAANGTSPWVSSASCWR